jgi:hypothetical protein
MRLGSSFRVYQHDKKKMPTSSQQRTSDCARDVLQPGKYGASVTPTRNLSATSPAWFCTNPVAPDTMPQMITTVGRYNRGLKMDRSMFEGTIIEM